MLVEFLKSVDYGGYYFFRHLIQQVPELVAPMQLGGDLGSAIPVFAVVILAVLIFARQRRFRAAQASLIGFALAAAFVGLVSYLVAARRPEDAQDVVGAAGMASSFPASSVFLFTYAGTHLIMAAWGANRPARLRLLAAGTIGVLVLWVAISPLALGLHFVTDVIGGLTGGLACALLASRFFPNRASDQAAARPAP